MATVLQKLLEAGVVEIDDDAVMEKLLTTAENVEKQLTAGRLSVAAAALVAMDPEISPGEPMLESIYQILAESWKTVKTRHPDKPLALLRGVLAQALVTAGQADPIAAVIWLTANSYRPYAPLAREEGVWRAILLEMRERTERAAEAVWNGQEEESRVKIRAPEILPIKVTSSALNSDWLALHLAAAAGQASNLPEDATPNTNPVTTAYQVQQMPAAWADFFGIAAAKAIARAVNSCMQDLAKSIDLAPLSGALAEHVQRIGSAVNDSLAPLHAVELRTRALYWRESLFSRSQRQQYRKLSAPMVALIMAADLAKEIPPMSPASVDSLLWEAVHAVLGDRATTIGEFAIAIAAARDTNLMELLEEGGSDPGTGRKTLLAFVRQAVAAPEGRDVRAQVGVQEKEVIPFADLACWLFRDLRAEKIVASMAPRVSRKRK
jgi:hypothetical protein